ncbi:MAG: hypothetical protein K2Q45_04150 [Nitrosomonas sp.]|nr:hypothetical protein [Nitrosomonas sp.]
MKRNHLTRASDSVTDVRTGLNPVGVLKRVIRFKSCEKPNNQPVYLTVTGWLIGQIMTSAQPPSSAHCAASRLLPFPVGCFFIFK